MPAPRASDGPQRRSGRQSVSPTIQAKGHRQPVSPYTPSQGTNPNPAQRSHADAMGLDGTDGRRASCAELYWRSPHAHTKPVGRRCRPILPNSSHNRRPQATALYKARARPAMPKNHSKKIVTKRHCNWSPGLILGAFCTIFRARPVGTGLGVKFGRKPAKKQMTIITCITYSKRR